MDRFGVLTEPRDKQETGLSSSANRLVLALVRLFLLASVVPPLAFASPALAQGPIPTDTPGANEGPIQAPGRIDVQPTARDEEIRARLESILEATGWFQNPQVEVRNGVVFLNGQTTTEEYKTWAGDLARNTQDVAAVVNQIEPIEPSIWNFQPALNGLRELWLSLLRSIPLIGFGLLVLLITWVISRFSVRLVRTSLANRLGNPLLRNVAAYTVGVILFLIGLYIVFQVAGLTSVALTVVGGTGLLGLVLGIAFRDITENFLASIFLSLQTPFRTGDLVDIAGTRGYVQALTTRATLIMTLNGNHMQIPNATVYKSKIENFTSNPNLRVDFIIGIGYDDSVTQAQEIALKVLEEHPAVLEDPEPMVLVDSLGSATVNLRVYFWLDVTQHSWQKVKSSVIRLVKRAFQAADIEMPDEAREMIFPNGISIRMVDGESPRAGTRAAPEPEAPRSAEESEAVSTKAEAGLSSEAGEIEEQARKSWKPEEGENLLDSTDSG